MAGFWKGRARLLPYLVVGSCLLLSLCTAEAWALSETLLSLFLLLLILDRRREAKPERPEAGLSGPALCYCAFLVWTAVSGILASAEKGVFLLEFRRLLLPFLALMALKSVKGNFPDFFRKALPGPALVLAIWILLEKLGGEARPDGPWLNANIAASALWASFLYLLPQALRGVREKAGLRNLAAPLLILAAAGATASRGALVAALGALAWEGFRLWREKPGLKRTAFLAGGLLVLVLMAWPAWNRVMHAGEGDHLSLARILIYPTALRISAAHPFLGLGWGQFGYHYPLFKEEALGLYGAVNPHNSWLHVLCETGAPGLFLFGLAWFQALAALYRRPDPEIRGARLALGFLLLHGLFEENLTFTGPAFLALAMFEEARPGEEKPRFRLPLQPLALLLLAWNIATLAGTELQLVGTSALEAGNPKKAAGDFRAASWLLPLHEGPWLGEGEAVLRAGETGKALALAQRVRRLAPLAQDARWLLCRCLLALGRGAEAAEEARGLANLDPKNALHLTRVAGFLEQAGDREGARQLLVEAQRLVPGWEEPTKRLQGLGGNPP